MSVKEIYTLTKRVVIAQCSTYFDKEIYELPIYYTKNKKLGIPRDRDEGLSFYIKL